LDANVDDLIRVFISSKQSEFQAERAALFQVIQRLPLLVPVLAEQWPPQRLEVRERFLRDVRRSPIYVGLFGCVFSEPTVLEYETAIENPAREILIYIKRCPEDKVEGELRPLLQRLHDGTVKVYDRVDELLPVFETHLWRAVGRMIGAYMELQSPLPVTRGAASSPFLRSRRMRLEQLAGLGLPGGDTPESAARWAARLRQLVKTAGGPQKSTPAG
jgi:hypothetical protein